MTVLNLICLPSSPYKLSPFGSATSRNGFLGNSPIFPAFSSIFRAYSAKKIPSVH